MKKDNHQTLFLIPKPDLQIDFSARLLTARRQILQQALLETMGHLDIATLDQEAHEYVPKAALKTLAGRGLRAELVFALPSLLRANPRLLGYYRLLLGFLRKISTARNSEYPVPIKKWRAREKLMPGLRRTYLDFAEP